MPPFFGAAPVGSSPGAGDSASPALPGPLGQVIPVEVVSNPGFYFAVSGLFLAFVHRDKVMAAVARVFRRK